MQYQATDDPKKRDDLFVRFWEASAPLRGMLIRKFLFEGVQSYLSHQYSDFESIILFKTLRAKLLDQFDPTKAQATNRAPCFNFFWLTWYRELQSALSKGTRKLSPLTFIGEEATLEFLEEGALRHGVQPLYESRFSSEEDEEENSERAPKKPKKKRKRKAKQKQGNEATDRITILLQPVKSNQTGRAG
jgi:hypothetical protein